MEHFAERLRVMKATLGGGSVDPAAAKRRLASVGVTIAAPAQPTSTG